MIEDPTPVYRSSKSTASLLEDIVAGKLPPPESPPRRRCGSSSLSHRIVDAIKVLNMDHPSTSTISEDIPEPPTTESRSNSRHRSRPRSSKTPTQTQSSASRATHSRSPHTTSDATSTLLQLTTERLAKETARANEAERQAAQILSHFKSAHEDKLKLERDLTRTQAELSMYKMQLDVAQKEIFRAQELVDRIDKQRVEAEEDAKRARDRLRALLTERAVKAALEEGQRLGYEEGLRQGRSLIQLDEEAAPPQHTRRKTRGSHTRSHSDESHDTQTKVPRAKPPRRRSHDDEPRPTEEADRATKTQPSKRDDAPETISIHRHEHNAPLRPVPVRQSSPAPTHASFAPPPDNFIPTANADSRIRLPPPHEMQFIPPLPSITPAPSVPPEPELDSPTDTPETSTPVYTRPPIARRRAHIGRSHSRARTMSTVSAGSTHFSRFDILRSPVDSEHPRAYPPFAGSSAENVASPTSTVRSRQRAFTQPEPVLLGWKAQEGPGSSTVYTRPPSRGPPSPRPAIELPIPPTAITPITNISTPSRRPREIVLPVPLTDALIQHNAKGIRPPKPNPKSTTPPGYARNPLRPKQELSHSASNNTLPGIEVVTPSEHGSSPSSTHTVMNPVMLTPESANRPLPPPAVPEEHKHRRRDANAADPFNAGDTSSLGLVFSGEGTADPSRSTAPAAGDLSPIMGMANIRSYPPGFGPPPDAVPRPQNFTYPSSPFLRSK